MKDEPERNMQRKKDKSVGILLSGGLDSAALVGWFLNREFNVYPIYISAGLRWEKTELEWAHKFLKAAARPRLKKLAIIPLDLAGAYDSNWSQRGQTPGARSLDKSVFFAGPKLAPGGHSLSPPLLQGNFSIGLSDAPRKSFSRRTPCLFQSGGENIE